MEIKNNFSQNYIISKLEKYCLYQDRYPKEIENKIKEYTQDLELIKKIIEYLTNENFLNEERYVKNFINGKINIKKWGKNKIIYELKNKNISNYNIEIGIANIDYNVYIENITHLYNKKKKEMKNLNKIIKYLLSKGYEIDLINKILYKSIL